MKSEETGNNIFQNSAKDFKINIFPTSEEKHINAFGNEIRSPSLLKENVILFLFFLKKL